MFTHTKSYSVDDITVVGGGIAGVSLLLQTVHKAIEENQNHFVIRIIEKTSILGSGFAFDPTQHITLKINDPINETMIDIDHPNGFFEWIQSNQSYLKSINITLSQIVNDVLLGSNRFPPRALFGLYCQAMLKAILQIAKKNNITIHQEIDTEITYIKQLNDQCWHLTAATGKKFITKTLVLATGHVPSTQFKQLELYPNFHTTPYQHSRIHAQPGIASISPDTSVVIIGSGLSAIDAAKLLNSNGHHGKIYMVSKSCHLPRLKEPSTEMTYQLRYLNSENLKKLEPCNLDELKELVINELKIATNNPDLSWNDLLEMAERKKTGPKKSLDEEIESVSSGKARMWKLMLGQTFEHTIPIIWRRLSNKEKDIFFNKILPIYLKNAAGIPIDNAIEIQAMMLKGILEIKKIDDSENAIQYLATENKYQIMTDQGHPILAHHLIDATGTGHHIKENSLLSAMLEKNLILAADTGGLLTTPDLQLINPNGISYNNAYGIGANLFAGSSVTTYDSADISMQAKKVANQIINQHILTRQQIKIPTEMPLQLVPISYFQPASTFHHTQVEKHNSTYHYQ